MRILFLSRWFPWPASNGSKLRIYNLLRGMAPVHNVALLSFSEEGANLQPTELTSLCYEIDTVPWREFEAHSWRAQLGFLSPVPRSIVDTWSPEMAQKIKQALAKQPYDLIIASQLTMAGYSQYFGNTPALFEEIEIGVFYEQSNQGASVKSRLRNKLTWAKHRRYLNNLLPRFKAATVVSEPEQRLLAHVAPAYKTVEVIPNCITLDDYAAPKKPPQPNTLIFTGPFRYHANYDAMVWFLREVYPLIQEQIPDAHLYITGDHANLPLPPVKNLTLTGFVDDIQSLIASTWVSLAPLRIGGGTRLKILEAMALGTPVVATSKGAEGLNLRHNEHLLIADAPAAFAKAVISLLKDPALRQRLGKAGFQLLQEQYNWPVVIPKFLTLLEKTARA